jgi:hypothetical protein
MKTFKELYQQGNEYRCDDYNLNCEIVDVRFSKTGRVSAKVKNEEGGEFWTTSVSPDKVVDYLHSNKTSVTSNFTIK